MKKAVNVDTLGEIKRHQQPPLPTKPLLQQVLLSLSMLQTGINLQLLNNNQQHQIEV
jgi:hypothetical protein